MLTILMVFPLEHSELSSCIKPNNCFGMLNSRRYRDGLPVYFSYNNGFQTKLRNAYLRKILK